MSGTFVPLPARTLHPLEVVDAEGPLSLPAGTQVRVVDIETLGSPFGEWVFEHAGRVFKAPYDAIELRLPPGQARGFFELVDELLSMEEVPGGAAHPEAPGASSASPEEPPTVQDVLDLLQELGRQHTGGGLSRDEFEARKKELLARIRRHRGEES